MELYEELQKTQQLLEEADGCLSSFEFNKVQDKIRAANIRVNEIIKTIEFPTDSIKEHAEITRQKELNDILQWVKASETNLNIAKSHLFNLISNT